jgi:predicted lipid-binding transport protein (Tim44 family)
MKKLLTLLATLAVAACLSMPAFAQDSQSAPAESAPQSAPAKKSSKKKHAKTKKEKKSKKKMESTEPSGQ